MDIIFNRVVFLLFSLIVCMLVAVFELVRAYNAYKKTKTTNNDLKRELEEMKRKTH